MHNDSPKCSQFSVHNFLFNGKIETKLRKESHKICASLFYAFNLIDVVQNNKLNRIIPAVYVSWLFFFQVDKIRFSVIDTNMDTHLLIKTNATPISNKTCFDDYELLQCAIK